MCGVRVCELVCRVCVWCVCSVYVCVMCTFMCGVVCPLGVVRSGTVRDSPRQSIRSGPSAGEGVCLSVCACVRCVCVCVVHVCLTVCVCPVGVVRAAGWRDSPRQNSGGVTSPDIVAVGRSRTELFAPGAGDGSSEQTSIQVQGRMVECRGWRIRGGGGRPRGFWPDFPPGTTLLTFALWIIIPSVQHCAVFPNQWSSHAIEIEVRERSSSFHPAEGVV